MEEVMGVKVIGVRRSKRCEGITHRCNRCIDKPKLYTLCKECRIKLQAGNSYRKRRSKKCALKY